jgi:hypothetical protein
VAILRGKLGVRPDLNTGEYGASTPLDRSGNQLSGKGVIESLSDSDWFKFTTAGGPVNLTVVTGSTELAYASNAANYGGSRYAVPGANLDVKVRLLSASGTEVATPYLGGLGANVSANLSAGEYYLVVESAAARAGDLGLYTIFGSAPAQAALPATATLIGPSGTISSHTPTFSWNAAANASWYHLQISNSSSGQNVFDQWMQNTTSYTVTNSLASGSYSFMVQTYGNGQYGGWSTGMSFVVQDSAPATATLIGPSGTISSHTPTFSWNAAANASWYHLQISNSSSGQIVFDQWMANTTSYTVTNSLASGSYSFKVQTYGNGQYGGWSTGMSFVIQDSAPGTATLIGPSGTISSQTPTFSWNAAANADWYYISVYNRASGKYVISLWLYKSTSYTASSPLTTGSYSFSVLTYGNGQYGTWSAWMNFDIS